MDRNLNKTLNQPVNQIQNNNNRSYNNNNNQNNSNRPNYSNYNNNSNNKINQNNNSSSNLSLNKNRPHHQKLRPKKNSGNLKAKLNKIPLLLYLNNNSSSNGAIIMREGTRFLKKIMLLNPSPILAIPIKVKYFIIYLIIYKIIYKYFYQILKLPLWINNKMKFYSNNNNSSSSISKSIKNNYNNNSNSNSNSNSKKRNKDPRLLNNNSNNNIMRLLDLILRNLPLLDSILIWIRKAMGRLIERILMLRSGIKITGRKVLIII